MTRSSAFFVALAAALASPAHAQTFEVVPAFRSFVHASDDGTVVVGRRIATNTYDLYADGEVVALNLPAGAFPSVWGSSLRLSGDGGVLSGVRQQNRTETTACADTASRCDQPFVVRWRDGVSLQPLPRPNDFLDLPSVVGTSAGVSMDGLVVVQTYRIQRPSTTGFEWNVLRWTEGELEIVTRTPNSGEGGFTKADAASESGQIVAGTGDVTRAAWYDGAVRYVGVDGEVTAMAPDASVMVGREFDSAAFTNHPFRWEDGQVVRLGFVNAEANRSPFTTATSVSRDGTMVLGQEEKSGASDGFEYSTLWTEAHGIRTLTDVLQTDYDLDLSAFDLDPSISFPFVAHYMSPDGVIVGEGTLAGSSNQVVAWIARLSPPEEAPLIVNSVADRADEDGDADTCDTGETITRGTETEPECTLRAAIETANARAGRDSVTVDIVGTGPHTIPLTGPLPALAEPLVLDATTQPGYAGTPLVTITGTSEVGLALAVGQTTIRGVAVGGFSVAGVRMSGPGGNRVEASHLGVTAGGTAALPNGVGVRIESGGHELRGNVIPGNAAQGVLVTGASASGVVVAGNRIGTTADGRSALPNGAEGVLVDGAPGVRLGGPAEADRNVIAGNGDEGVVIRGVTASGVVVAGNVIGTDATGAVALLNGGVVTTGVIVDGAPSAVIGGATAAEGNVIVGSLAIEGPGADGARVQGNTINLSADGTTELDAEAYTGIDVRYASGVTIGGATGTPGQAPGNAIVASGADASGISVLGEDAPGKGPADGLRVLGNLIGTDGSGAVAIPVGEAGVQIRGLVRGAQIGQAGGGNVIVAHRDGGVEALDLGPDLGAPDGLVVAANRIGLNADGTATLGEVTTGIRVGGLTSDRGVEGVVIGGDGENGNRISAESGVFLIGARTSGARVASNVLGLLADGRLARADVEAYDGITTLLADAVALDGNTVAGYERGIVLASSANVLTRNRVGTNEGGSVARPNELGVLVPSEITGLGDPVEVGNANVIGEDGAGNVISGNDGSGVVIGPTVAYTTRPFGRTALPARLTVSVPDRAALARIAAGADSASARRGGAGAADNVVAFNRIGANASGSPLGNGLAGVVVQDGRGARLVGNAFAGNAFGLFVGGAQEGDTPGEVVLAGNTFRENRTAGAFVADADRTVFTALPLEDGGAPVGNVFERNAGAGVVLRLDAPSAVGNRLRGATFHANGGPSISLTSDAGTYPALAPRPPEVYTAVASGPTARVVLRAGVAGEVELFASTFCPGGEAEGEPVGYIPGSSGLSTADVPLPPTFVAATVTTPGDDGTTSAFSACVRVADEEDAAEAPVAEGETGVVLDAVGVRVEVTGNPAGRVGQGPASGTLYAARYRVGPEPSPFEGEATAPDGAPLAPNAVAAGRHWTLRADGLAGVTYDVCLDVAGVPGVQAPDRLVVLHRETARRPWTAHDATLDGSRLCAAGLTAWGDLGLGADSLANPVRTEPLPPDAVPTAFEVTARPNPARGRASVRVALPTARAARVAVYDVLGRRVATLHDGPLAVGEHPFALDAGTLRAGVYLVRVEAGGDVRTRALTVAR